MEINYFFVAQFFFTFMIIMFVDGIKLLIEVVFCGKKPRDYKCSDGEDTTIVVAAYNEAETIIETIKSLIKIVPSRNIIIADDGSKDNTIQVIRDFMPEITVLTDKNKGKVGAINRVLEHVKTPYVLLMDADTQLEDGFKIPTEALECGDATAVAFNIQPIVVGDNFINRVLLNLQSHEYNKSTQIGKRFNNKTKSVHCISGAIGLFKTDRLIELSKKHTTIFPGEDLERTLHELMADGNVIFSESTVYTDAPQTMRQITKQRVIGWWPGLWRNIWLFLTLIVRRREPARLRYELIYEVFALVTIPFKILSLISLIIIGAWNILLFIFIIYLLLEIFVFFRIKILIGKYMKMEPLVILMYPFYALLQMMYVTFAFFVFLYKKFLTNDWSKAVTLLFFALLPFSMKAQNDKDNMKIKNKYTVDLKYSHITDSKGNRKFENYEAYIGYNNLYASILTKPYNTVSIGGYFGSFIAEARYGLESKNLGVKLQYEHWFGSYAPCIFAGYGTSELSHSVNSLPFFTAGLGINYYFENSSSIGVGAIKEFTRDNGVTFIAKTRIVRKSSWTSFGASITNFGYSGAFGQIGYKWFYIHGDYYQHFDFNNFNRSSIGAGIKLSF